MVLGSPTSCLIIRANELTERGIMDSKKDLLKKTPHDEKAAAASHENDTTDPATDDSVCSVEDLAKVTGGIKLDNSGRRAPL